MNEAQKNTVHFLTQFIPLAHLLLSSNKSKRTVQSYKSNSNFFLKCSSKFVRATFLSVGDHQGLWCTYCQFSSSCRCSGFWYECAQDDTAVHTREELLARFIALCVGVCNSLAHMEISAWPSMSNFSSFPFVQFHIYSSSGCSVERKCEIFSLWCCCYVLWQYVHLCGCQGK